ncbi:uncharacterized protein LOC122016955 [Zingiber officinale]|uniref:Uncharacterized protein n=1 Tax=Zingiber officinale TaxID=94328 RepID=A0A8J5F561_ZINOF|nr:uncharacterized protein LOC122016955 [Zingiber officinale]KAG6481721.1 hypothetical protein ZIOFF_058340 [Zingiber officinale]
MPKPLPPTMVSGSVLRAMGRAVGGGVLGPLSSVRTKPPSGAMRVSSSSGAASPTFASAENGSSSIWSSHSGCLADLEDWERVADEAPLWDEEVKEDRHVFGSAPSREEAEDAVSTLRQMLGPVVFPHIVNYEPKLEDYDSSEAIDKNIAQMNMIYNSSSESTDELCHPDWIEPSMQVYSSDISNYKERQNALDALQLFNANATLQRMVVSISSDEAVWDAVMNNKTVQELKKTFLEGASESSETGSSEERVDTNTGPLGWMFENAKTKLIEFIDKITRLAKQMFLFQKNETDGNDAFEDAVRSSLLVSIFVFVIVIMKRLQTAS